MEVASSRQDLPADAESLLELLARANHLLSERFSEQLKLHGLTSTEWRVLAALHEHDGVPMTELAEQVLFKQPTLTKAIDRMERAQLVQRRTPSEDRRRTLVHLTERGRRIAAPLVVRARQHETAITRVFGDREMRELCAALQRLIDRVQEMPHEHKPTRGSRSVVD